MIRDWRGRNGPTPGFSGGFSHFAEKGFESRVTGYGVHIVRFNQLIDIGPGIAVVDVDRSRGYDSGHEQVHVHQKVQHLQTFPHRIRPRPHAVIHPEGQDCTNGIGAPGPYLRGEMYGLCFGDQLAPPLSHPP